MVGNAVEIQKIFKKFVERERRDPINRYRSWVHCYSAFQRDDLSVSDSSLHLAFYLASWGMYRGSTFLLQKDYTIHIPVIERLRREKGGGLNGAGAAGIRRRTAEIMLLRSDLRSIYKRQLERSDYVNGSRVKTEASDVLITKILLGTLACVPVYDRYFVAGAKAKNISVNQLTSKSVTELCEFYESHCEAFEEARVKLQSNGIVFPSMKLLDTYFWELGAAKS